MTKRNLRNKLDGNQLDLSLSGMTVVPVKELASIPKATRLDLSCNQILSLPDAFCDLTHLIKLDLSKNMIQSLPDEFGNLVKLQQLDLYNNQLKTLPLSFSKLKHLQWLDLKNNPLEPHLQSAAGDCLDEKECKLCAKRVVAVMCQTVAEHEHLEALKIETEKLKEEEKKLAEERELEKIRNNKKLEKLKKRQKYEASQRLKMKKETKKDVPKEKGSLPASNGLPSKKYIQPKNSRPKCYTGLVITICATIFAVIIGIYLYCSNSPTKAACEDMWKTFTSTKDKLMIFMKKYITL